MPAVSIAMATYNGAKYLREQIDSLAAQTLLPVELVITDDGSTDNTADIVTEFAKTAPFPVHFYSNPINLGYRGNFMKAASLCSGKLIAFCDQDDVWLPNKLEKCAVQFENPEVILAYHAATVTDEKLNPIDALERMAAPYALNGPNTLEPTFYSLGFTLMFNRALLAFNDAWRGSIDFYDGTSREAHDQWFFSLASGLGTIAYISDPLVLYRRHENTTTDWIKPKKLPVKIHQLNDIGKIYRLGKCARVRARTLEMAQNIIGYSYRKQASYAYVGYRMLHLACERRIEMYASHNPIFRLYATIALWRMGGYRPRNQWGMGPRAIIRDLIMAFLCLLPDNILNPPIAQENR